MRLRKAHLAAIAIGVAIAGGYAGAAHAQREVVVLFDRSGSMSRTSSDPNCSGLTMARCGLNYLVNSSSTANPLNGIIFESDVNYYFWEFRARIGAANQVLAFPSETTTAFPAYSAGDGNLIQHINGVAIPRLTTDVPDSSTDLTPLAQAYCQAVNFLATKTAERNIVLISDGLHTPVGPTGIDCQGPDRTTGTDIHFPDLSPNIPLIKRCRSEDQQWYASQDGLPTAYGIQIGSWQGNMIDMALTGALHITSIPDCSGTFPHPTAFVRPNATPFIMNAKFLEFLETPVPFSLSAGGVDDSAGSSGSFSALAAPAPTGNELIDILAGVSHATGGRLTIPGRPGGVGDPFALPTQDADANEDGCVNTADFNRIQQFFGQQVDFTNPISILADVNGDGVINDRDYTGLSQHFGQGCTTPPGPLPRLNSVLFGFDSLADWSSPEAPLSQSANRRQGTSSLVVGKVGANQYRAVNSVPFSTALFQGLVTGGSNGTTKIKYDIFIPANPVDPFWIGQTQLFVSCPSANLYNVYLGAVDLTGKPLGAYSTVSFNLPTNVRNVMLSSTPKLDFSFKVVVNSKDANQLLDKMQFTP
jgi:hypothetical protein